MRNSQQRPQNGRTTSEADVVRRAQHLRPSTWLRPRRPTFVTLAITSTLVVGLMVAVAPASSASSAISIVPSPNPTPYAGFGGVACPSINNCVAVGDDQKTSGSFTQTLIEHWNGTSWSIVPSPNPTVQPASALEDVSCPSTNNCFAVGQDQNASGSVSLTLIEHWNGTNWSIMLSPNAFGLPSSLSDVACPSTTNCFAVGGTWNKTASVAKALVEHWNGTSWSIVPSPTTGSGSLNGVSCPSTTSCFAVGYDISEARTNGTAGSTLVEHWNGTSWSIVPSPTLSTWDTPSLRSVSCPSISNCFAVGYTLALASPTGSNLIWQTLIEHWNGTSWSIVPSPKAPAKIAYPVLAGVVCASTTDCLAVGAGQSRAAPFRRPW